MPFVLCGTQARKDIASVVGIRGTGTDVTFELVTEDGNAYWLGLSRSPPRLLWSWQQQRMYLIKPSRLNKLPTEGVVARLGVAPDLGP